jgi:hypothetical protein
MNANTCRVESSKVGGRGLIGKWNIEDDGISNDGCSRVRSVDEKQVDE